MAILDPHPTTGMRNAIIGCVFGLLALSAEAGQDDDFIAARNAFQAGDRARLARVAPGLQGYVLEPYVAYWQVKLDLDRTSAEEVQAFLKRYENSVVAERMRADWLKVLATRANWALFNAEYPLLQSPDAETICYSAQARMAFGDLSGLAAVKPLWTSGRDQPAACTPMFEAMLAGGQITTQDVWARMRLALEAGQVGLAKKLATYLPPADSPDPKALDAAADNPRRFLEHRAWGENNRSGRELAMFALYRLARVSPQQARDQWVKIRSSFPVPDQRYAGGHIAYQAALRQDPQALVWFREAGAKGQNDQQLSWYVRSALRGQSWEDVLAATEAMSLKEKQEASWRYWRARAYKSRGRAAEANQLFAPISTEQNFYGRLALEDLGEVVEATPESYQPPKEDVEAMAQVPSFKRAIALYRFDMRLDGVREWAWGLRGLDDQKLLAAAEVAKRNGVYDRAIATAEKTRALHDFSIRYPVPFREAVRVSARQAQLDEAWVYGVMRQESRFQTEVRSSAGAMGLMQLMPATAKWVAKRIGMADFQQSMVTDIETNIRLGTYYLRYVYDMLDASPVLASAAYNAGPGRARQWRAPTAMEGAIYAESIPLNETRDYVKKVLANATYYAVQLKSQTRSLKERLGIIPPRYSDAERPLGDTP
jgi:soluble lytic murein transglycosylase